VFVALSPRTSEAQLPREVEFQFNYRPAAFEALAREIGNISIVVPEWFFIDSTGTLNGEVEERVLELARRNGVPVMAQVKNYDRKTGLFSATWASGLLNTRSSRQRAIARFVELSKKHRLYGIQVELEGVHISDRDSLSLFIREAATALHREGFKLSVSAIHKEEEAPGPNSYTQWMYEHWRGAYDLRALGQAADFVRAVVYAQHTRRTPPGPSQNLPWLTRVMEFFVKSVPAEKLVIGLGMGAQHWYTVADPKLYYQGARSWSRGIRRRDLQTLLAEYGGPPLTWDDTQKMSFSYIERAGVFEWVVSDNDVRAFDAKLALARKLGVRGVSMWVNGDEEPGIWSRFRPRRIDQRSVAATTATTGIPVFLWHYFADSVTAQTSSLTDTYGRFDNFLAYMKAKGFTSVFPEDARVPRVGGGNHVILTFDDGRKDQLRAAEILEKHGFKGVFFVVPTRTRERSDTYLTREDIGRLTRAGHRIAVHGTAHRSLASSGSEGAASVAQGYRILGDSAGVRPSAVEFAMPFGHYTPETIEALATRYRYLMSVNPGYWDGGSVMIPRMLIFRDTPIEFYRDYLDSNAAFHPTLTALSADGSISDTVAFKLESGSAPRDVALIAVSADAAGKQYEPHPLGDAAYVRGDTLFLDLRKHRDRYFGADRNVIAYALMDRANGRIRYLTRGVMHWLRDPAGGPLLRP
jgi:spore germination protein YaaH/peptidoglycan/xylan/chitin deacetylase (PgdA/CDA1 family)